VVQGIFPDRRPPALGWEDSAILVTIADEIILPSNGVRTIVGFYVAVINLDDNFVGQMKASMSATGGLLSMSSTTYRYYQTTKGADAEATNINISCQNIANKSEFYPISTGQNMGITGAQFRIDLVLYPHCQCQSESALDPPSLKAPRSSTAPPWPSRQSVPPHLPLDQWSSW